MSNTDLVIEERSRDIGDFLVGRYLPFRKKRMVGPFIFIDHMGPSIITSSNYLDIDQHPHIGLSTLTYLFEGEVEHRDTTGTVQRVKPGEVNLMTAGQGVTHTERTPEDLRNGIPHTLHGFQIWVALKRDLENMAPEFHHFDAEDLPRWSEEGLDFTLVAGTGFGHELNLPNHSNLFIVEIKANKTTILDTVNNLKGEIGICIVKGQIRACDIEVQEGNMLVSKIEDACKTKYMREHIYCYLAGIH